MHVLQLAVDRAQLLQVRGPLVVFSASVSLKRGEGRESGEEGTGGVGRRLWRWHGPRGKWG